MQPWGPVGLLCCCGCCWWKETFPSWLANDGLEESKRRHREKYLAMMETGAPARVAELERSLASAQAELQHAVGIGLAAPSGDSESTRKRQLEMQCDLHAAKGAEDYERRRRSRCLLTAWTWWPRWIGWHPS